MDKKGEEEGEEDVALHPWNHAPRELLSSDFDALLGWWEETLRIQHSHITDALSGRRLDVLQQCVAIGMEKDSDSDIKDAHGLSETGTSQPALVNPRHAR